MRPGLQRFLKRAGAAAAAAVAAWTDCRLWRCEVAARIDSAARWAITMVGELVLLPLRPGRMVVMPSKSIILR